MRHAFLTPAVGFSLVMLASTAYAESAPQAQNYNQPTRGFFIEHGNVSGTGKVSVELQSGSDRLDSGGGIRLGLPGAELIINSGLNDYDENQILLKWGMPDFKANQDASNPVSWSVIGGVSDLDFEDDNGKTVVDQTNLKLGVAATLEADAATFTLNPLLVYADGKQRDDTFVQLGVGGYVGVIDTVSGLFSLGIEAILTSEENTDNTFAFGGKWAYNKQINLDIIPVVLSDGDLLGVPGLVRLNVAF